MLLYDPMHTNIYHVLILFLAQLNNMLQNLIPVLSTLSYICGYKKYKLTSWKHIILVKNNISKYDCFPIYIMKIMNHVEH